MDKNLFYKLSTKILTGEATVNEQHEFENRLQEPEYRALFEWLNEQWQCEFEWKTEGLDLDKAVELLFAKMEVAASTASPSKKVVRLRRFIQAAAAVIILLVVTRVVFFHLHSTPEIARFAENTAVDWNSGNTRLILQGDQVLTIDTDESKLDYAAGNGIVVVDDKKTIQQKLNAQASFNTIIVPYGKRSKIILSDSTEVWLNSGSRLVYPPKFTGGNREVYLEGEALFDVRHHDDKPFLVLTDQVEVKVLGTRFNVTAYADNKMTQTLLERGSVEIHYNTGSLLKQSKVRITPGTLAAYNQDNKQMVQKQVNPELYTSWHDGYLIFREEKLSEIAKQLRRYYNVNIKLANESLAKETFSGKLDLKDEASKVFESIAFTSSLKIEKNNNQIILKN